MTRRLAPWCLLLFALWLTACSTSPGSKVPSPQGSHIAAVGISHDGRILNIVSVGPIVAGTVGISGLDVDIECAQNEIFTSESNIRIDLLKDGCAKLIGSFKNPAEQSAQRTAQRKGKGFWAPGAWTQMLNWSGRNWLNIISVLSFIIGILGLSWIANRINRVLARKYERKIRIVVSGASSAGKTDLWKAWKANAAPRSDSAPTVGFKTSIDDPVPYGKFTLLPTITDIAGTEPWLLTRQLRGDDNTSYSKLKKMRRVLIFVVSPCQQNTVQPGTGFDQGYVAEQKGYAHLPMAVIAGDDYLARPDMVIMFISKFDLISSVGPQDTNAAEARKLAESVFREHRRLIEAACRRRSTSFACIIGSAKEGWGVRELRDKMREVMNV